VTVNQEENGNKRHKKQRRKDENRCVIMSAILKFMGSLQGVKNS
jgi:hypothetical protein